MAVECVLSESNRLTSPMMRQMVKAAADETRMQIQFIGSVKLEAAQQQIFSLDDLCDDFKTREVNECEKGTNEKWFAPVFDFKKYGQVRSGRNIIEE